VHVLAGLAPEELRDLLQMRVVGNPANTNALIAMNTAKSLPRTSFTSMSLEIDAFSQERIALRANGSLTPRITR
jgi:malate dehydrogenase